MPKVILLGSTVLIVLAIGALIFFGLPVRMQMLVYPLVRQATQAKLDYQTRDMAVYETEHFTIKYSQQDEDVLQLVAQAAEKAYQPVAQALDYIPVGKTLIFIYPNKQELNRSFGWSADQSAMGVYWGGVIQILSPHAWMKEAAQDEFIRSGPIVHEFAHLILDRKTNGNYPRWFTEGLAQYVEYQVNHYEWRTATNSLGGNLYSMTEMDAYFDNLPDQSLAYRESLAAVRYIAGKYGDDALRQVISDLEAGMNIQQAIRHTLGINYSDYEAAWRCWAAANMN